MTMARLTWGHGKKTWHEESLCPPETYSSPYILASSLASYLIATTKSSFLMHGYTSLEKQGTKAHKELPTSACMGPPYYVPQLPQLDEDRLNEIHAFI